MSLSPPRRPSTLAAQQFADANRPLGTAPAARPGARSERASMMGVGRSSVANAPAVPARLVSSIPMRTRAPQATPYATGVRGAARPVMSPAPDTARKTQLLVKRAERERNDHIVVTSVVIVLLAGLVALGSLRLSGSLRDDRSRSALNNTFGRVFVQQGTFRVLNRRFATWSELAARGATLGPRQRVIASNASASHWFLSVRDTSTGITCSRTGELFDNAPTARSTNCSDSP